MKLMDQDTSLGLTSKEQAALRDSELVSFALAGSSDAFAELQRNYSRHLYSTIFGITKNREDSEDALQDTFLRAYRSLCDFEGRSSFYSWLTRIAINSALMMLRKRRAHPEVSFDLPFETGVDMPQYEFKDPAPNPEQVYVQRQQWVSMVNAIQRLEPGLQEAIRIRLAHGSSLKEIAQTLDISVAAVKSRIHRARKRLTKVNTLREPAKSRTVRSIPWRESHISGLQNREQPCMSCNQLS
jgi:RNA polymerase sigma-70 factor, ECF subfamily